MQLAGLAAVYPSLPSSAITPLRAVESAGSADLARAAFAPTTAASAADTPGRASAEAEQDRSDDTSASDDGKASAEPPRTAREEQDIRLQIAELSNRDQEVRAHEQAHAAVGGVHAGAPTYTYTRGPDGKRYATEGEVSIDVGAVANDPQATLSKMQVVLRAALAPAEPSAQDRRVAAQAQAQMSVARVELAVLQREQAQPEATPVDERADKTDDPSVTSDSPANRLSAAALDLYSRGDIDENRASRLDLRA